MRFRLVLVLTLTLAVVVSSGSLLFLNGRLVTQMRGTQVAQQFEIVAASARSQVFAQFVSADAVLDTLSMSFPATGADEGTGVALARVLAEMQEGSPAVLSVYVARADGSVDVARKFTPEGRARAEAAGVGAAAFEVQRGVPSAEGRRDTITYLDAAYRVVGGTAPFPVPYDARARPWYRLASGTDVAVITPPYRFQDYGFKGITLSRRGSAGQDIIFGVDLTLSELSDTLRQGLLLPEEQVVVFEPGGALIGASGGLRNVVDLAAPAGPDAGDGSAFAQARAIFAAYRANPAKRSFTMEVDGQEIMADLTPFRFDNQEFIVASHLPADVFREPLVRWTRWSLGLQLVIVILAFVLALRAAHLIAGPIMALTREVEAIVAFDFPQGTRAKSRVWEIRRLAGAIDMLEVTLRAFSTYLPAHFVRGIVETKAMPQLGGAKRTVVVLFTDIAGFTTLAEALPPDALMRQMSRYLKELSDEILAADGTVDKFIGDSVMAFWADGPDEATMARKACAAVVEAARRIDRLNASFVAEGMPAMPTRFGMHMGEAMVGSVGTLDRMNYTVLGHTVNVASRIEGLNKVYGTTILVTEALVAACGTHLDVRPVDSVMVRGASGAVTVFELREAGAGPVGSNPPHVLDGSEKPFP